MPQSLRAALIGCGRIGAFTRPELVNRLGPNWMPLSHADALSACEGVQFVACCDSNLDAARDAATRHANISAYSDFREMLAHEKVDILAIATRTDVREAIIVEAVDRKVRGIHSEKPLALSLAQTEKTIAPMKAAGTAFSYGALRRHMPVFVKLRDAIREGEFGDLQNITIRFGRGGLLWTHPHSIDLICYLSDDAPVEWVQANLDCETSMIGKDRTIDFDPLVLSATIMFKTGVTGTIVPEAGLSVDVAGSLSGTSVFGDGAWTLTRDYGLSRDCQPLENWHFEPDTSKKSGRLLAVEEVRDALRSETRDERVFDRILEQHRIMFALAQSHLEDGRRISPENVDPHLTVTGKANGLVA